MSALKAMLINEVRQIDGVEDRPSAVAGGSALFYRGKEFAHFHNDHELDLRLTNKVIKALGVSHPPGSIHHPARSASSPWIEVRYGERSDVAGVVHLIRRAIAAL